jgi:hypothetical protein
MSEATRASVPDMEVLAAEVANLLENAPVAEALGAKLSRLLHAFLQGDVLPQVERAADMGLDPTPLLNVVSDVLRLYVDTLERRQPIDRRPAPPGALSSNHLQRMKTERSQSATVKPWTVEMP